ncbi:DNA-deoxyinosine glycosylase [Methylotuvimicrobium buryatense]|uniref:DNA-deoxyinosine glycosylase n=1 Tax=Methylotuvimicrobium buryatense TaxID=95641 RepID=A0A4V1IJY7_METBY|nr:DNA-deoxyinosine glycosylase [Methylotuvimicrobium buryatense]QCW83045.1 DNA-deoxyinosine glycosylase [Methylotuvimicrobium buryatense]
MSIVDGFPPIAGKSAEVLILGSMPSVASLSKGEYYGHPRNGFWLIMRQLFGAGPELDYLKRSRILIEHHLAVWDVLQTCYRPGSADANIDVDSIKINDFNRFFEHHRDIKRVLFNGGAAESLYRKRVLPILNSRFNYLEYQRVPSTSPAYAAMSLERKTMAWKAALGIVVNGRQ